MDTGSLEWWQTGSVYRKQLLKSRVTLLWCLFSDIISDTKYVDFCDIEYVSFFHTNYPILWLQLGVQQFISVLTLATQSCHQAAQVQGLSPTRLSPLQTPPQMGYQATHNSAPPTTNSGVPLTPLRLENSLELSTELRKTLKYLPVCHKGYSSGTAKWKRCIGQGRGWEKWLRASLPSLGVPPSQHISMPTCPSALQTLLFSGLNGGLIT